MAALPAPHESPTVTAIYSWWANRLGRLSRRLGASQIGRECERQLWYGFRWATGGEQFDGRTLRLFNRGHREEAVFVEELRGIGCRVLDIDPSTGEQFTFTSCGGHLVAKIDGTGVGIPDAPKTWHILSFKTSNEKGFAILAGKKDDRKAGVGSGDGVEKGKPEHYAQNQLEMHLAQLDRTLYLAANKDTDELYAERLRYDRDYAERLHTKAERVIFSAEPLPGISDDPAFYKCKQCPAAAVCHTPKLPAVSCRSCLHATPEKDGDGRWSCARWRDAQGEPSTILLDAQATGCQEHRYIPALLRRWGEAVDANEAENWVEYRAADGHVFRNGAWAENSFTSKELAAITPTVLRDAEFMQIRARHAGTFVDREQFGEAA